MNLFWIQALLVCNVFMRAFTDEWRLLPKLFNVVDIAIVILLAWMAAASPPGPATEITSKVRKRLIAFNAVLLCGALANLHWFRLLPAFFQWIMWCQPLILFLALQKLPLPDDAFARYSRLLKALVIIQLVIGLLQVPDYLRYDDSERIVGTFYGNATQYQGFAMLALYMLLDIHAANRLRNLLRLVLFAAILILILAIDNKATWLGVAVSLFAVVAINPKYRVSLMRHVRLLGMAALGVLVWIVIAQRLSPTLSKFSRMSEAWETGNFRNLGKVKAIRDVATVWRQHPHMALIGAGPATFYSRSGRQFYAWPGQLYQRQAGYDTATEVRRSHSMAGVVSVSAKPPFYEQLYERESIFRIGTGQVDEPFSSYAALLGETGLVGTVLYLGLYVICARRLLRDYRRHEQSNDRRAVIAGTWGFLVYVLLNSAYSNWLETTRISTTLWTLIALSCRYPPTKAISHGNAHEA